MWSYLVNSRKIRGQWKGSIIKSSYCRLGVIYAVSRKSQYFALLQPVMLNSSPAKFDLSCLAALLSGMIAVSSLNAELTTSIIQTMMKRSQDQLNDPFAKSVALSLTLTCIGQQDNVEVDNVISFINYLIFINTKAL